MTPNKKILTNLIVLFFMVVAFAITLLWVEVSFFAGLFLFIVVATTSVYLLYDSWQAYKRLK